jgi:hypothetical protein
LQQTDKVGQHVTEAGQRAKAAQKYSCQQHQKQYFHSVYRNANEMDTVKQKCTVCFNNRGKKGRENK